MDEFILSEEIIDNEVLEEEVDTSLELKRELMERDLLNIWGHSKKGIEAKKAAMSMLSTKTGMYARIPLMCKGDNCPYVDSCMLSKYDLAPNGEACPKETAEIELRYAAYDKEFELDKSSFTDKNLVSELINYDIMLDRLRALISKEQVLVVDVVTGISENGEEYTHPEVSKTWEAYERVEKKRNNVYDLMLATRKSNKDKNEGKEKTMAEVIEEIMNKDNFIIEVKPEDLES